MGKHLRVNKYLNEWMLEHRFDSKVEVSYHVAREMHGCGVPVEMLMSMSLKQAKEWRTIDGMMHIRARSWCRGCEYDKKRRVFVMELLDMKAGGSARLEREADTFEVAGSNPAPPTKSTKRE